MYSIFIQHIIFNYALISFFIRSSTLSNLSPIESIDDSNTFDNQNLNNLFEEMSHMNGGLSLKTHRYHLRSYHSCFLGYNLIDWLLNHGKVTSR